MRLGSSSWMLRYLELQRMPRGWARFRLFSSPTHGLYHERRNSARKSSWVSMGACISIGVWASAWHRAVTGEWDALSASLIACCVLAWVGVLALTSAWDAAMLLRAAWTPCVDADDIFEGGGAAGRSSGGGSFACHHLPWESTAADRASAVGHSQTLQPGASADHDGAAHQLVSAKKNPKIQTSNPIFFYIEHHPHWGGPQPRNPKLGGKETPGPEAPLTTHQAPNPNPSTAKPSSLTPGPHP